MMNLLNDRCIDLFTVMGDCMKDHRETCDRWASQPQSEIGKVGLFDFVHLNGTFFGAFPVWIGFADRHSVSRAAN